MSFWCLQFPPKSKRKQVDLRFSKEEFVRSFFGGNVGLKKLFQLCMTLIGFNFGIQIFLIHFYFQEISLQFSYHRSISKNVMKKRYQKNKKAMLLQNVFQPIVMVLEHALAMSQTSSHIQATNMTSQGKMGQNILWRSIIIFWVFTLNLNNRDY